MPGNERRSALLDRFDEIDELPRKNVGRALTSRASIGRDVAVEHQIVVVFEIHMTVRIPQLYLE